MKHGSCVQVVILRGLNLPADAKLPDFMPLKVKTPLHVMQLYGANVARVIFTWEAFEPTRGNYSMEYLDYYLGLVEVGASRPLSSLPLAPACKTSLNRLPAHKPMLFSQTLCGAPV